VTFRAHHRSAASAHSGRSLCHVAASPSSHRFPSIAAKPKPGLTRLQLLSVPNLPRAQGTRQIDVRCSKPHPLRARTPARPDSTDCQQRGQTVSALTGPSSSSRRRLPVTDPDPGKHFTQRGEYPARPATGCRMRQLRPRVMRVSVLVVSHRASGQHFLVSPGDHLDLKFRNGS
jgi:hypothetical protein